MFGLLVGLVPALGFGMMGPLMQRIGGSPIQRQMGLVLAALVASLVALVVHPPVWSASLFAAAALNGISWSIAELLLIKSFDELGVSHAAPISTGLQLLGASALGVLFLGEWRGEGQLLLGGVALALVVFGVFLSSRPDEGETEAQANSHTGAPASSRTHVQAISQADAHAQASSAYASTDAPANFHADAHVNSHTHAHGMLLVVVSSLLYVSYAAAGNFFDVDGLDLLFPQALFMLVTTALLGLPLCGWKFYGSNTALFGPKTWQNLVAGIFFAAGNAWVLVSNQINGLAVGWTLSQLNVIVSTLGGLLLLHEHRSARGLRLVVAGMTLVTLGGILIGLTKA